MAVSKPFTTVTTELLELDHVSVRLLASTGITTALSCSVSPLFKDACVLSRMIFSTGFTTVTVQLAVLPFDDLAVMIAVPLPLAISMPFFTNTTDELELDHVMDLSVAFEGETVAVSTSLLPRGIVRVVLLSVMLDTGVVVVPLEDPPDPLDEP
jgi:hypothetical protein